MKLSQWMRVLHCRGVAQVPYTKLSMHGYKEKDKRLSYECISYLLHTLFCRLEFKSPDRAAPFSLASNNYLSATPSEKMKFDPHTRAKNSPSFHLALCAPSPSLVNVQSLLFSFIFYTTLSFGLWPDVSVLQIDFTGPVIYKFFILKLQLKKPLEFRALE